MSTSISQLARNGSHTSISTASTINSTSHHHHFHHLHNHHPLEGLKSWLETWKQTDIRYERIALGHAKQGIALTRQETMEMQIQHTPHVRGMIDCLPSRQLQNMEMGWRPKLGTWPLSKHEAMVAKRWGE